jgi:hypothetical protein
MELVSFKCAVGKIVFGQTCRKLIKSTNVALVANLQLNAVGDLEHKIINLKIT